MKSRIPPEVSSAIPQQQLSQNAPPALQDSLYERVSALPGVHAADNFATYPALLFASLER